MPDLNVSLGSEATPLNSNIQNLNYIPAYKEYEEQRQENELARQSNEETRVSYHEYLVEQKESGALNGPANVLEIGTVERGENASATITGTAPSQVLNLVLPKGDTGATGATGAIDADVEEQVLAVANWQANTEATELYNTSVGVTLGTAMETITSGYNFYPLLNETNYPTANFTLKYTDDGVETEVAAYSTYADPSGVRKLYFRTNTTDVATNYVIINIYNDRITVYKGAQKTTAVVLYELKVNVTNGVYYDIADSRVSVNTKVTVKVSSVSQQTAIDAGMQKLIQLSAGHAKIYCLATPTEPIHIYGLLEQTTATFRYGEIQGIDMASDIAYNNTNSGLTSDTVQEAIDEVQANKTSKDNLVVVSSTQPTTGEKVWLQKGKNLIDKNTLINFHLNETTGAIESNTTRLVTDFIYLKAGTYTISCNLSRFAYVVYNENKSFNRFVSWSTMPNQITLSNDCYIKCEFVGNTDGSINISISDVTYLQLEGDSTATAYEAYIEPKTWVKNSNGVYEEFKPKNDEYTKKEIDNMVVKGCVVNGIAKAVISSPITAILPTGLTVDNIAITNVLIADTMSNDGAVDYYSCSIFLTATNQLILSDVTGFPINITPRVIISYIEKKITPVG